MSLPLPRVAAALGLSSLIALAAAQSAAAGAAPAAPRSLDCMIQPHQIVQVGSPAAGVIERILVDRGDLVTRGQTIVQLVNSVERAALGVARERARQGGELTAAAGSSELARRELERAIELERKNFVSQTYLDKQRAEAQVASGRADQAAERRRLAEREVELAAAQLAQRTIGAPIDGVVVERYLSPGEFVDQKPILRIAAIDPLRVDVLVPAAAFGRVDVGMKGRVVPELLQRRELAATVKTVDRVVDAATNTFRVRLELPNPGGALPAGLRCKVDLGIDPAGAEPPAAAAAAAPVRLPAAAAATPGRLPAAGVPVAARRP